MGGIDRHDVDELVLEQVHDAHGGDVGQLAAQRETGEEGGRRERTPRG
jgi:hypothetical protein